ncbi:MAG: CvpA family protein [Chloroflexota bacterium]
MTDLLLALFIAGYVVGGWRTGLLRRLAGLVFVAIGLIAGAYLRVPVGALVTGFFTDVPPEYGDMVGYAVTFAVIVMALNLVSGPILSRATVGGVSRMTDRTLGAVLGGVEAVLIISAAIVILDTYFGSAGPLAGIPGLGFLTSVSEALDASAIGRLLTKTTVPLVLTILGPFLPTDVTSVVPGVIPKIP